MKTDINIIELFSGIGGFSKGIEEAGFKINKHYFSEIDKHAISNYKYNFPNAEFIGDVKSIQSGSFTGIDIITFGSPCQDFSLAGKRKGLEGDRSSLIEYAIRIISDLRPSVFIWENVKGAFSSNSGADFWAILQAFANIGGYRLEWQLLNTKWFLPQNRERIYLVGHLTGRSRSGVFPVGENEILNFTPGENKKKIHPNNRIALTQQARQYASWNGDFVKVKEPVTVIQKTGGYCTTLKENETGTLQAGGANVMDKVPNIIVSQNNFLSEPIHKHGENRYYTDTAPTIQSRYGTDGDNIPYVNNIRRLTEIECERLQGFPDDWTKYGNYDGKIKETPKTQRYKMCGNAVTVAVVKAVASKIQLT